MITSYEQLPYGIFAEIKKILTEGTPGPDTDVTIVSLLSGKSVDDLINGPISEYLDLKELSSFLYTQAKPNAVKKEYKAGDYTLVVDCNFKSMKTSQYLDFQEYIKQEGDVNVQLLSCFLIPKGETYGEGYDVLDVQNAIRDHLCLCDVAALQDFFSARLGELMLASLTSSAKMTGKIKDKKVRMETRQRILAAQLSLLSGAGSHKSTLLRTLPTLLGLRSMTYQPSRF